MASAFEVLGFAQQNFLLYKPIAVLTQASVQSLPSGTLTAVTMDTSIVDSYSGHSGVNPSRYTAQVPGWYEVTGTVGFAANGTGVRAARLMVNGSGISYSDGWATTVGSGQAAECTAQAMLFLHVNDYVEVGGFQTSGGGLNTSTTGPQSSMTVVFEHP